MNIKSAVSTAALFVFTAAGAAQAQDQNADQASQSCDWRPDRAVTFLVPWGAGGGTDANARMLASMLEERWNVPFNVVNRTGGNGVTGHTAIINAQPDGYTIGAPTVEINTLHWIGLTDITYEDLTPLALIDAAPASVLVQGGSQFETLDDLLSYARENPGELTASGTALGGIWHLALAGMLNAEGMDPNAIRWIPSQGAASALQELIAGGVDVATPTMGEARGLIESGDIRPLATMDDSPSPIAPDAPMTAELLDSGWTLSAYVAVAGPDDMDENIACSYAEALQSIIDTEEWAAFKESRGGEVVSMSRDELEQFMAQTDASLGETISAIGLAR